MPVTLRLVITIKYLTLVTSPGTGQKHDPKFCIVFDGDQGKCGIKFQVKIVFHAKAGTKIDHVNTVIPGSRTIPQSESGKINNKLILV